MLHCMGVTQLASSLAKDKSAFIGMLNITEEETKKEKESKRKKEKENKEKENKEE